MLALLTKATDLEQQFQKNAKNTIILFIDLQGSTQYKTTHTFFESLRKIITHNTGVSDIIRKNNGIIVKWLGDGIMARFSEKDIIKSIKSSVEIQRFFAEYNKDKSKEDKIKTKIGISIGHCLEISNIQNMTNDLMGIPVDAAARIQMLAKPGQILIDYKLRKKISLLQKKDNKNKKLKELKISFSSPKLRNLRGIGSSKLIELRWDKFLEIQKEDDDLTREHLKDLAEILSKNNTKKIIHNKSCLCKPLLDDEQKQIAVKNAFEKTQKKIRILAYSLNSWKERIEKPLLDAVQRGVKIEILVLSNTSKYRFEKTLYESFRKNIELKDWIKEVQEIRKSYQSNLQNTIDTIKIWQSQLKKSQRNLISIRSYDEMPNYYGFMFDEDKLYFSSFYVDLTERGYNLPAVFIEKNKETLGDIILQGFQNWFDIKFTLNDTPKTQ